MSNLEALPGLGWAFAVAFQDSAGPSSEIPLQATAEHMSFAFEIRGQRWSIFGVSLGAVQIRLAVKTVIGHPSEVATMQPTATHMS